ncbi:MAG: hypothetical protein EOP84_02715 [Verrucomicrobiaceae bacterium]|nr:MAG: hypothetical protein EOP84_02715 [Verrucomicrobiaceae bacterium]
MSYRKLEFQGEKWSFKIGEAFVNIRDPANRGYVVKKDEVHGLLPTTQDELEREMIGTTISPAHIKAWIDKHLGTTKMLAKPKKTKKSRKKS